ncbi:hypothetical protein IQ260_22035 [Leptolyngbya cf. ectocarpi LEGE 11479]|uniref:Nitrate reductase n=1 Tax=Leptolyngbya cf. ectocarpi LEGE 11479 TaxID=1828722 RepID=A0A928ZXM6_LEPEC|nr:hypothetical protein [Leptolyngbya ectocarpi]MBE9069327.1 hypothetical protein [Leptolyngbya cf. ectocarpi LEGE 11479]
MGLFDTSNKLSPAQLQQIKSWVYQTLALEETIPVSISQLTCTEPGCPPLETVISVMTQPPKTYKLHQPAAEISQADVVQALRAENE